MSDSFNETIKFSPLKDGKLEIKDVLLIVYKALEDRGYDSKSQMIGYILSGDPTYITNHEKARNLISQIDRDELLDEILSFYMENKY